MASPPFLDLNKIDLSQVAVSTERIAQVNPHRGDMRQLDHIIWVNEDATLGLGVKYVRDDEFWVSGHVPGRPILPGVLIIYAVLPFWERLRQYSWMRQVLVGVNATAIGLVVAAVFLLWERADPDPSGAVIALLAFGALGFFRVPAPLVIVGAGVLGWVFSVAGLVPGL